MNLDHDMLIERRVDMRGEVIPRVGKSYTSFSHRAAGWCNLSRVVLRRLSATRPHIRSRSVSPSGLVADPSVQNAGVGN